MTKKIVELGKEVLLQIQQANQTQIGSPCHILLKTPNIQRKEILLR